MNLRELAIARLDRRIHQHLPPSEGALIDVGGTGGLCTLEPSSGRVGNSGLEALVREAHERQGQDFPAS